MWWWGRLFGNSLLMIGKEMGMIELGGLIRFNDFWWSIPVNLSFLQWLGNLPSPLSPIVCQDYSGQLQKFSENKEFYKWFIKKCDYSTNFFMIFYTVQKLRWFVLHLLILMWTNIHSHRPFYVKLRKTLNFSD